MLISMLKNQNIEFDSLKIIYFKMMLNNQNSIIKYLIVIFFNCQQNEADVFKQTVRRDGTSRRDIGKGREIEKRRNLIFIFLRRNEI